MEKRNCIIKPYTQWYKAKEIFYILFIAHK